MLNPSDPGVWQRTSPFAIVFFVGRTIKSFARSVVQLVATFGALAVLIERNRYAILVIPFGILAIIAGGVLQYWFFRFRLEEDRILIRQGVLKKTALDLPFDRVQGINVERSLIDRILGLVTVSLDTAGSVTAEGQLPAVNTELADWLRTRVGSGRRERSPDAAGDDEEATDGVTRARPGRAEAPGEVVLKLTRGDIIRIGLANRNIVLAVAFVGLLGELLEINEAAVESAFESAEAAFQAADELARTILVVGLVLAGLGVVLAIVIGGAFLRYHDFTLWREGTAFRSRAGLLTQKEVVVETAKIQQLTLSQNLLMRLFRGFRLRALPAALLPGQGADTGAGIALAEVLEVPLLKDPKAEEIRSTVFGGEGGSLTLLPHNRVFVRVSPHYIRALTLRISVVSALIGATILLPIGFGAELAWRAALGVLIWWLASIPPAALIAWQRWHHQAYLHDDDGLASRSGFLGRKVDAFLFRKAQSVTVRQSPLQRRKGLATLQVHLACGQVAVPYLDHGLARRLRDHMLCRVESSQRRWH